MLQGIASVSRLRGIPRNDSYNGYIWHTTGSGKTLTSFKSAQIIMDLPDVHKVVFVVDRKDLDYQTMNEFNSFKKDCVDVTSNTRSLVRQFTDDTKLIVTTIQKLNRKAEKLTLSDRRIATALCSLHHTYFIKRNKPLPTIFVKYITDDLAYSDFLINNINFNLH